MKRVDEVESSPGEEGKRSSEGAGGLFRDGLHGASVSKGGKEGIGIRFQVSGFRFQVSGFRLNCIVEAAVSGRLLGLEVLFWR
jgi:hypothetical protein